MLGFSSHRKCTAGRFVVLVAAGLMVFGLDSANAADMTEIHLENFNDRNFANNLSGEMVTWNDGENGSVDVSFDAANVPAGEGSCLKMAYSLTDGGFAGISLSLMGKMDRKDIVMNFKDVYGDLKNSQGNPVDVEGVKIAGCRFRAKGNGDGEFDHTVKLELEDRFGNRIYKLFNIPNTGGWQDYEFAIEDLGIAHLDGIKSISFGLSDYLNDKRASHFFVDDIVLETDAPALDIPDGSDDAFLDLVSHRAFHYFLTFTDTQGFALERSSFSDLVSIDAIGYQLAAYCIGHYRGWADAGLLEARVETILTNLNALPQGGAAGTEFSGYKGFFYTFLNADTGKRKDANSQITLYSNTLLMFGVLTAKAYFPDNPIIQAMAGKLYDAAEWDWMVADADDEYPYKFRLAWTPENGFSGYVDGYTDESLLANILALGSPTHPTTMET